MEFDVRQFVEEIFPGESLQVMEEPDREEEDLMPFMPPGCPNLRKGIWASMAVVHPKGHRLPETSHSLQA